MDGETTEFFFVFPAGVVVDGAELGVGEGGEVEKRGGGGRGGGGRGA